MTIAELIGIADELVENPFSTGVKLMLVNEIEGRIQHDLYQMAPEDVVQYTSDDITEGTELLLGAPWNQVYLAWMKSMYYWHMAEYNSYENEHEMFNNEWTRLARTISEHARYGTSTPPTWTTGLPTRLLAGRLLPVQVTYDETDGTVTPALSYEQMYAALTQRRCMPVCMMEYLNTTLVLHLAMANPTSMVFTLGWDEAESDTYVHAVLTLLASGEHEFVYEEA